MKEQEERKNKSICFMADTKNYSDFDTSWWHYIYYRLRVYRPLTKYYFEDLLMLEKARNILVAKHKNFMQLLGVGNIKTLSLMVKKWNVQLKMYFMYQH